MGVSAERVAQLVVQRALRARMGELTERERNVMRLVADGRPNKLIADELGISVRTVEVHRARVFEKMDVKSAVQAVARAAAGALVGAAARSATD